MHLGKTSSAKNIENLLTYLYKLNRRGIKLGLEHTIDLLKRIENPQNDFKSIHIAGTNGKGSTCSMISSILLNAGYKVGLYSSPHLVTFNERIKVNNQSITNAEIALFIEKTKKDIDQLQSTFFEVTTAMAFDYFAKHNVDIAIIETGLGGRLDATNVLKPIITGITSISLDHRNLLGNNILNIAKEKGGIIKNKTPLVLYPNQGKIKSVLLNIAKKLNAEIIEIDQPTKVFYNEKGTFFCHKNYHYNTPLIGEFQAINAIMAITIIKLFDKNISEQIVQNGLSLTKWPGRFQRMTKDLPIYYDVAHNVDSIKLITKYLKIIYKEKPLGLFVIKESKELGLVSNAIKNNFHKLIVSGGEPLGLMDGDKLGKILKTNDVSVFKIKKDFNLALNELIDLAKKTKKPALILGSHYIAKPIFDKFGFYN
ncbi:MAG: folylpolyglutamate synthase/dihydrofolate synthase family protein [Candidatus Neomarinimicrobiota bacterium]|nr:folylpolyglutamate synthase/dihydrofolate synthase family protein [Candidatus Neomarinimicrobiota bacterium]